MTEPFPGAGELPSYDAEAGPEGSRSRAAPAAVARPDDGPDPESLRDAGAPRSSLRAVARTILSDGALAVATAILLVLALLAVIGPMLWTESTTTINLLGSLDPPSLSHPMGTDSIGRDVFARFNAGARLSLLAGLAIASVGAALGGSVGLAAGLSGGWLDQVLMRLMDGILAFPPLVLAIAVTVGLGKGVLTASLGVMIVSVPWYARVLRSEVLRLRSAAFIEASRALGAGRVRIVVRHIVPHTASTVMIQASAVFAYGVLTLAALGFVGLGAQTPTAEWGAMITDGLPYALTGQWWITVFPGFGILLAVTAASLIADRCRDLLDPHGHYEAL